MTKLTAAAIASILIVVSTSASAQSIELAKKFANIFNQSEQEASPQAIFKIKSDSIDPEEFSSYAKNQLRWLAQGMKKKGFDNFTVKIETFNFTPPNGAAPFSGMHISIDGIPFMYKYDTPFLTNENALFIARKGIMAFVQNINDGKI